MKTEIITDNVDRARAILRGGGLVAVPTETVYGLACDGLNADAVESVYDVKGRPPVKPLALMVPGPEAIGDYGEDVPPAALALAEKFWPGPLTLVLRAKAAVPAIVRAGSETVGLRCPDHPLTLSLLRVCGFPLAGPSANPSGAPSPRTAGEVLDYFDGKIDAVLDGGPCALGTESTVFDMSRTPYRVLRQGAVPEYDIRAALADRLFLIGLTGGTGAGKTTALRVLQDMGALTIDCDEVYHRMTEESDSLREALTVRFGPVYEGRTLDRKKLGAIVFADKAALGDLNAITHRSMAGEIDRRLRDWAMAGGTVAAVDAIALIQSGFAARCDAVVAVTAPAEVRVRRIMAREGVSEEYARLRIAAQPDDAYYRTHATATLVNDGTPEAFGEKCAALFRTLLP